MSGGLRPAWGYLNAEVWEPLADYSGTNVAAPSDLFSDLFAEANEYLAVPHDETGPRFLTIRNDAAVARAEFLALRGTDFANESAIVRFLESARTVISDYEIPGFEDLYHRLVRDALRKFNLRYRLDEPFILRFLLPGSFTNLYAQLQRLNTGSVHLTGLLTDFEKAFDRYARTQDSTDLKTCISKASNYAEGLASVAAGIPASGNTLGALCNQTGDWPHDQVKEALQKLYKFCSDYPGIRHAGNPAGVRRDLATRDMTLACLLLLSFSGYLAPNLDHQLVLGV
jgi:hypothetical protein